MSYNSLIPLMEKKGCVLSSEDFQKRVNVVFHDHEADHYDKMHSDMKNSLQEQVDLLVKDLLEYKLFFRRKLRVLDIGCGTGLSSEFLINSKLEPLIDHLTLMDTSEKMLEHAKKKAETWGKDFQIVNLNLPFIEEKYDFVLICSVLHHIPDLSTFLLEVNKVLNRKGILMHLQDPNADHLHNNDFRKRVEDFKQQNFQKPSKKKISNLIPKQVRGSINRLLGRKNYIDRINDQLIREGIIKKRMSADELWSVTDIHVPSHNSATNKGISFSFLEKCLQGFLLVNQRSYGFFGKLKSDLDPKYSEIEEKLIAENRLDGRNLACVWIKD